MPIGAHKLLSFLAEPLKQLSENLDALENYDISEDLSEFQDWVSFIGMIHRSIWFLFHRFIPYDVYVSFICQSEYYSCDATYRKWLKIEQENAEVSAVELSQEEKERASAAAKETLQSASSLLLSKWVQLL